MEPANLARNRDFFHQPAGRVVDKHQQRALRPAVLEPPMLAAVDLYQFATAARMPFFQGILSPVSQNSHTPDARSYFLSVVHSTSWERQGDSVCGF